MNARLVEALEGCTVAIVAPDQKTAWGVVSALMTCTAHRGVHHFAVVNEGRSVVMNTIGFECLRDQGVNV